MNGSLSMVMNDITAIFRNVALWDVMRYALYGLWVLVLLLPLKKVDRRDTWSAVTYMMVICLYAVLFLVAMPVLEDGDDSATRSVMVVCIAAGAAAVRWFVGFEEVDLVVTNAEGKEAFHGRSEIPESPDNGEKRKVA